MQFGIGEEIKAHEYVLHRCDNPLCVKAIEDESTHLRLGNHSANMVERSQRGRSNFQVLRFSAGERKACAASAQALRDVVKLQGYDHDVVQRFVHELDDGQELLFYQIMKLQRKSSLLQDASKDK